MTPKQFTLHVDNPNRSTSLVHFWGVEYSALREASEAITGRYGHFHAFEILGRAFVLTHKEALEFVKQEIPFIGGYWNGKSFMTFPGRARNSVDHIRWGEESDIETAPPVEASQKDHQNSLEPGLSRLAVVRADSQ